MNEVVVHQEENTRTNYLPASVDKRGLFRALNTAKPAADLTTPFSPSAVFFGSGQVIDKETGDVRDMDSCTFICKEGSFITFSPTLLNSFESALRIWGEGISKEIFKIQELKSSRGRSFFVLDIVDQK